MTSEERVEQIFWRMLGVTENDRLSAAILTGAVVAQGLVGDLDHKLCMGLRHGLFGSQADSEASVMSIGKEIDDQGQGPGDWELGL